QEVQSALTNLAPGFFDRLAEAALDVRVRNRTQGVPGRAPQESEHRVIEQVADAGGQTGGDKRNLAILPEGMLNGGDQLVELVDLLAVDLVQGDQDARVVLVQ